MARTYPLRRFQQNLQPSPLKKKKNDEQQDNAERVTEERKQNYSGERGKHGEKRELAQRRSGNDEQRQTEGTRCLPLHWPHPLSNGPSASEAVRAEFFMARIASVL